MQYCPWYCVYMLGMRSWMSHSETWWTGAESQICPEQEESISPPSASLDVVWQSPMEADLKSYANSMMTSRATKGESMKSFPELGK